MSQSDDFGSDFQDFVVRVEELRASRTGPTADHSVLLDAALLELQHIVETMGPAFEEFSVRGTRASSAVQAELRLFKAIFEHLPLPVALVDSDTVVRRVNEAAVALTGVPAGFAAGRQLGGFLRTGDRAALRSQVAAVARGEGSRSLTVHLQQEPEHPLHVSLSDLSLPREPGTAVLVTLRPAADADPLFAGSGAVGPSAAQPDAVLQAELTDLLDRTTGTLLSGGADTSNELLTAVAAELCEQLGDWAVLDLTAATGSLRRSAVLGLGGSTDTTLEKAVTHQDPYGCKVVAEAAATGFASLFVRPDDLDCLGSDDSGASLCVRADVTSLLVLPLTSNRAGDGRILGVLTVLRSGARPSFSLAEARAAEMVARHMAIARERGTG